jgi:hypothetical protein
LALEDIPYVAGHHRTAITEEVTSVGLDVAKMLAMAEVLQASLSSF